MDEMNKLPEEQSNEELHEQEISAPESAYVDGPVANIPTPKAPLPKLPFIIGGVVAGFAAIAVTVAVVLGGAGNSNQGEGNNPSGDGHEHSYGEWTVVDNPTCLAAGIEERVCDCGANEMRRVDALGHTEVVDEAVEATCKATGLTAGKHCSTCGTIIVAQSDVAKLPHTYDDASDADCNVCGETRVVACTHAETETILGKAATCTATGLTDGEKCKKCGETIVAQETLPIVAHTYDNKYDEDCNVCGHKRDAECGHFETEIVNGYAATCTETGLTDGEKCKKCGETLVAQTSISITPHTETTIQAVDATCSATGLTEGIKCSICGTIIIAQQETPKIAHTYDDKYDETCNKCGFVRDAECAHTETEALPGRAATCTKTGITEGEKCKKCGEIIVAQKSIPTIPHTEVIDAAVNATCTSSGLTEGKHCSVCGKVIKVQNIIPMNDHNIVTDVEVDATCTTTGLTEGKHCTDCGKVFVEQETVSALGHTEVIDEAVEPTCDSKGLTEGSHCSICGKVLVAQKSIPMVSHTYDENDNICNVCGFERRAIIHSAFIDSENQTLTINYTIFSNTISRELRILTKDSSGNRIWISNLPTLSATGLGTYTETIDYSAQLQHMAENNTYLIQICYERFLLLTTAISDDYELKYVPQASDSEKTYTVVWKNHDGTTLETDTNVAAGSTPIYNGDTPIKESDSQYSYTFIGWSPGIATVSGDTTYTAQFSKQEIVCVHIEVIDPAVSATCTDTGLTEGKHCSVCGEVLVEQVETPMIAHTYNDIYDESCNKCGFIRDAECAHTETEIIPGKEATCTETGLTEGKKCKKCGEIIVVQIIISVKSHTEVTDPAVDPTCTQTGLTEGSHCADCGKVIVVQIIISATGHTEVTDDAVDPTCTTTGLTEGIHCSVCDKVIVAQTIVSATGHTEVIDPAVAPTCTSTGLTEGKHCSVCGKVIVVQIIISVKAHTEEIDSAVDSTCTQTGLTEGKHCSVCGKVLVAQNVVNMKPHTEAIDAAVEATCTSTGLTDGKHCSVCDKVLVAQNVVNMKPHTEAIDAAVEATCTSTGLTVGKHCSVCDKVLVAQNVVDMKPHTEAIDAAVEATCTSTGLTEGKHCSVCNTVLVAQTEIPAKGHIASDWIIDTEATCTTDGSKHKKCTVCGETVETENIVKFGHNNINGVCTVCKVELSSEGLKYTLSKDGTYYIVSGIGTCEDEDIIIPSTYKALPVARIGDRAFDYCKSIHSITLPDTITYIGDYAFSNCTELTNITLTESVISIGHFAFEDCSKLKHSRFENGLYLGTATNPYYAITDVSGYRDFASFTIHTDTRLITNSVFFGCYQLTQITIPNSVKSIDTYAFSSCTNLTGITIPDSVTHIGKNAFSGSSLAGIDIPDSVTSLGEKAFYGCRALTSIVVPDSVTSIGDYAFSGCDSLINISIGSLVTSIGDYAFAFCDRLETINYRGTYSQWNAISKGKNWKVGSNSIRVCYNKYNNKSSEGLKYTLNKDNTSYSITGIGTCNDTEIIIPSMYSSHPITSISKEAFKDCVSFAKIIIDSSVVDIGNEAFYGCKALTKVIIGNSVKTIGGSAFSGCTSLEEIHFSGIIAQWKAISKTSGWNKLTGNYTIYCTDGTIAKDGTVTYN